MLPLLKAWDLAIDPGRHTRHVEIYQPLGAFVRAFVAADGCQSPWQSPC